MVERARRRERVVTKTRESSRNADASSTDGNRRSRARNRLKRSSDFSLGHTQRHRACDSARKARDTARDEQVTSGVASGRIPRFDGRSGEKSCIHRPTRCRPLLSGIRIASMCDVQSSCSFRRIAPCRLPRFTSRPHHFESRLICAITSAREPSFRGRIFAPN